LDTLDEYRKSIDNLDNAIVAMLAERFKITNKVGVYKAENKLPAKDSNRELAQYTRMGALAESYGLDPEFAKSYLDTVFAKVVSNHENIATSMKL
jgi:chorismate mutase